MSVVGTTESLPQQSPKVRIFDLTGSYAGALWMFAAAMVGCTLAALACRSFEAAIPPAVAASAVA